MVEGTAQRLDDEELEAIRNVAEMLRDTAVGTVYSPVQLHVAADRIDAMADLVRGQADALQAATDERDGLQRRLFDECETAGWDPAKRNSFSEECAHLHEEVSEAFRAYRLTKDAAKVWIDDDGKPQGVPIELADVLIGLFYNAELHGFDLMAAVEQKHAYNLTRDYQREGRTLHPVAALGIPATQPNKGERNENDTTHDPAVDPAQLQDSGGTQRSADSGVVEDVARPLLRSDQLPGVGVPTETSADVVARMCHWKQQVNKRAGMTAAEDHRAFHFGNVCPYDAMAAVLRGEPDPRPGPLLPVPENPTEQR